MAGDIYREAISLGVVPGEFFTQMMRSATEEEIDGVINGMFRAQRDLYILRQAQALEEAFAVWRADHPWMEELATRLWRTAWRWEPTGWGDVHVWRIRTTDTPWRYGRAASAWTLDDAEAEVRFNRAPTGMSGVLLGGTPLGHVVRLHGFAAWDAENQYKDWLGRQTPGRRSRAIQCVTYWRQLYAGEVITVPVMAPLPEPEPPAWNEDEIPF